MTLQIIDWENETFSGKNLTNKKVDGFIKWIYEELGFQKSSDVYVKLCGNYTEFLKTIYKETARTKCVNADVKDLVQKNPIDQVYKSPVYEEWKQVIDINLTSTFLLSKYAIKKMLKNKYGKIVNIASVVGHTGNLGQANYSASKAGIIGMTKSLAIEYAKKNINLNCVSPGFIKSNMTDNISESVKDVLISRIPMSRLGNGDDVANSVAFLSSDQASYITGETIHVNGGMYMA